MRRGLRQESCGAGRFPPCSRESAEGNCLPVTALQAATCRLPDPAREPDKARLRALSVYLADWPETPVRACVAFAVTSPSGACVHYGMAGSLGEG